MPRKRGQYGNGSIDKASEDTWRLRYRINGKRFAKHVKGTKQEAVKELRRLLAAGDDGKHVAPNKVTVRQWVAEWLELKETSLKARTFERYTEMLEYHVVPALGDLPIKNVTGFILDKFFAKLTLAKSSAKLLRVVLKAAFTTAHKTAKLIPTNPFDDASKLGKAPPPKETILDDEELGRLVKGFEGHLYYDLVAVAAYTGMRRNEILALRLGDDIDLEKGVIHVRRNVEETKKHGRRIGAPKSDRSTRDVDIDASLVALLRRVRDKALQLVAGVPDVANIDLSLIKLPAGVLAFPAAGTLTEIGSPKAVTNTFRRHARKLGFHMHFHELRACHSTALLDLGIPAKTVAARLGDTAEVLLKHYAKRTKKADTKVKETIAELSKGAL
jgi:integrase